MVWNTVMKLSLKFSIFRQAFMTKIKISPWPFIATGTLTTVSVTLTSGKLITELNYNATRALTGQKYIVYLPVNP